MLANDTDPEGNFPLTLVSIGEALYGTAFIVGPSDIYFMSTGGLGQAIITYTVSDSLGAIAEGTLTVDIYGEQNQFCF